METQHGEKGVFARLGETLRGLLRLGRPVEGGNDIPAPTPWRLDLRTNGDRAFPPTGYGDTVLATTGRSPHESMICLFRDNEIRSVHRTHRDWLPDGEGPTARFNPDDRSPGRFVLAGRYDANAAIVFRDIDLDSSPPRARHLIPQLAQRSCGYAAGAMIALDALCRHNKPPTLNPVFIDQIAGGSLSQGITIAEFLNHTSLSAAGLKAVCTALNTSSLATIAQLTDQFGSVMLAISGEIGGHFVVIDKATRSSDGAVESFRLRDPYHGWDITVTAAGLKTRLSQNEDIVIIAPKGSA